MYLRMHILLLQLLCLLFGNESVYSAGESEANNPVFNLDHTVLEKNIAAIFNKVAHSSATTKRSVPAYEAQVSQSILHLTSPSPAATSASTSLMIYPIMKPKATLPPLFRELPSYAPPSRALFTPPLPPEYANPFADKPTLRGTNIDSHPNIRRPVPPPSLTPVHDRIPIKPPDLIDNLKKNGDKFISAKDKTFDSFIKDPFGVSDKQKDLNETIDFVPSLHFTSISRILSGSNGRKQDIPEILLKPISTKLPPNLSNIKSNERSITTELITKSDYRHFETSTYSSIVKSPSEEMSRKGGANNYYENLKKSHEPNKIRSGVADNQSLLVSQLHPPEKPSRVPDINRNYQNIIPHLSTHPLESTWKIVWSLHVYLAAVIFTLIALYSVYKIVRFNGATNLLTQSYFLTIHLLLTTICTLRCFHLFYDAYNLGHSLPETLSKILMFIPSSLLVVSFALLTLFISRYSGAPTFNQKKLMSPIILVTAFTTYITLCISLHVFGYIFGYPDESKILPLINQCIYVIICVTLGLCYMYVYRIVRSQLHASSTKSVNNHIGTDYVTATLNTAITTTIATALLFILMGFIQLYGIFGVQEHFQPYPWLWWGWEFSVRLVELSICGLIAWVTSLSQYQLRKKQMQQHVVHSGFALFPCGSSSSTENMDDALYPTVCGTNQAIQNYTMRTGKQVYDDNFPLNTLPNQFSNPNIIEKSSSRSSHNLNQLTYEMRNSFNQRKSNTQILCKVDGRKNTLKQGIHENSTPGSTMLVAEDGFVRFRNLGPDEDDLSDPVNIIQTNNERRNSITCTDKFSMKQPTLVTQNYQQNSLPHLHLHLHRNQRQIHNNT